jgi:hypothetical protein
MKVQFENRSLRALAFLSTCCLSLALAPQAYGSDETEEAKVELNETTDFAVIPTPGPATFKFSFVSSQLAGYVTGLPSELSNAENNFRQIDPDLDYHQPMVWLTLKFQGREDFKKKLRKLAL